MDVSSSLHPYEHSRFALALSSCLLVFGTAGMLLVAAAGLQTALTLSGSVLGSLLVAWILVQVARAKLLGQAVRVNADTLPVLQAVVADVREELAYHKPVDVYVTEKASQPATMTNYLGTRIILLEGSLVADLQVAENHKQLTYLIGRFFGSLKARHQQFTVVLLTLEYISRLKFLNFLLAPYFRATEYSGDQIGAICCNDFAATTEVMNRLLVGKELTPSLAVKGVLDQAAMARSRVLPRLAQMFMRTPHLTNRYLNLLAFAAKVWPQEFERFKGSLDQDTRARLATELARSPHYRHPAARGQSWYGALASGLAVAVLVVVGVVLFHPASSAGYSVTPINAAFGDAGVGNTGVGDTGSVGPTSPTTDPGQSGQSGNLAGSVSDATTPAQAPDGRDSAGNSVGYGWRQMFDGDTNTCWRTRGDGSGGSIQITLSGSRTINSVGLINGYAKVDPTSGADRYAQERKITSVTWTFDNGTSLNQQLDPNNEQVQRMDLSAPVSSSTVTLRVNATTAPDDPSYDYTAISEIDLEGQ